MKTAKKLQKTRARRTRRVRAKIFGIGVRPRLAVFRSNRFIYAQLIDDEKARTLASASSRALPKEDKGKSKIEQARRVGELLAKSALTAGIKRVVFDRRSYRYHGRVRALAEGVRAAGLQV